MSSFFPLFFFNDTATTEIYTLSLHDALPISIANLPNLGLSSTNINWSVTQSLSFRQPLWKNAFGRRTRAKARLAEYVALAHANGEAFKLKNAQSKAESIYWRLVLARALTQIRCGSLQHADE